MLYLGFRLRVLQFIEESFFITQGSEVRLIHSFIDSLTFHSPIEKVFFGQGDQKSDDA